ncbi:MAG TPA: phosphopantetheine-binding protein [Kofleriaceae bacterium]|nr:phosphopantetheine-binding protein [Kofleriaceae bacterium]
MPTPMATIDTASVKARISDTLQIPLTKLADERLLTDVVTESFAMVEVVIDLQEEFGVRLDQAELKKLKTVADLTGLVAAKAKAAA